MCSSQPPWPCTSVFPNWYSSASWVMRRAGPTPATRLPRALLTSFRASHRRRDIARFHAPIGLDKEGADTGAIFSAEGGSSALSTRPSGLQLTLAQGRPFSYKSLGTRRKRPVQHGQAVDFHQRFIFAVECVKVGRTVVVEVNAYDDSIEPAELRHV